MKKGRRGFTVWLTGLPCAGKTTLARLLTEELERRGIEAELLDGDLARRKLSKGLGFSREDRDENIRRLGFVCSLLSKHGVAAIAAAISPYRAARDELRAVIPNFVEVFVKASVETCIARDVKGLYQKALAGEIRNFTGVDDPYEPPAAPEVVVETDAAPAEACAGRILVELESLELIPRAPAGARRRRSETNLEPAGRAKQGRV
jgi:adenylyl-sulfate kinase